MEDPNIEGCLFWLFCFVVGGLITYFIISIPITIAKNRGVKDSELTTITILSWGGLLLGITWFIALALSLIYQPKKWTDGTNSSEKPQIPSTDNVEKLLKLNELKEKGIITQEEFEKQKKNLLSSM